MKPESDRSLSQQYKAAVVMNCIRKQGAISRTKIKEITGFRLASITEIVKELIDGGCVLEAGIDNSAKERGRKHILLKLNSEYGVIIGVGFSVERIMAVAVDVLGNILAETDIPQPFLNGIDSGLEAIKNSIRNVLKLAQAKIPSVRLLGIGVADPGMVDSRRGISVLSTTIDGWRDVPLKSMMEEEFGVDVHLEENTRAKLLAESEFGVARGKQNVMFIEFGSGIGCSFFSGSVFHRGATESAGELGHMFVAENGPMCKCGSYGCLEAVASTMAIAARAMQAIRQGACSAILDLAGGSIDKISADNVFQAAHAGDKLAMGIMDEAARYLGIGIANAVNLLNPQVIVFDARLGRESELLMEPVIRAIKRQAMAVTTKHLEFTVSSLAEKGGCLGAAAIVLNSYFEIPQLEIPEYL